MNSIQISSQLGSSRVAQTTRDLAMSGKTIERSLASARDDREEKCDSEITFPNKK